MLTPKNRYSNKKRLMTAATARKSRRSARSLKQNRKKKSKRKLIDSVRGKIRRAMNLSNVGNSEKVKIQSPVSLGISQLGQPTHKIDYLSSLNERFQRMKGKKAFSRKLKFLDSIIESRLQEEMNI